MDELRRLEFVRRAEPATPNAPARGAGRPKAASRPEAPPALPGLRARIDRIDRRIVALLQERAAAALQVRRLRAPEAHGHDVGRERELLARAAAETGGPLSAEELRAIYAVILRSARAAQRRQARAATVTLP